MIQFLSSKVNIRSLDFKTGHSKVLEEKTENRTPKFIAKSIQGTAYNLGKDETSDTTEKSDDEKSN